MNHNTGSWLIHGLFVCCFCCKLYVMLCCKYYLFVTDNNWSHEHCEPTCVTGASWRPVPCGLYPGCRQSAWFWLPTSELIFYSNNCILEEEKSNQPNRSILGCWSSLSLSLVLLSLIVLRVCAWTLQWGTVAAVMEFYEVPSTDNPELSRFLTFKPWLGHSLYCKFTCYTYCHEGLPSCFIPFLTCVECGCSGCWHMEWNG